MNKGYKAIPLSFDRKMVIASVSGNKKNIIHCLAEINVDKPMAYRNEKRDAANNKISFTAYLVKCLANTLVLFPEMNSFISRGRQIILDEITISVLVEREIDGKRLPEPVAIHSAQSKDLVSIHNEIRSARNLKSELGGLSGAAWIKYIPGFLLRLFVRIAEQNIKMAIKYGKVAITSVGMYSQNASWFIPHGSATVMLTVGGIETRRELEANGSQVLRNYLKLTASFDHELIDGAPAARFMNELEKEIASGNALLED